jgi:parvulin-like peptidyl-prolyl isomerase
MTSQTTRRPEDNKRPVRPPKTSRRYTKQSAIHVEARRDGQPLIFGYGSHLTKTQKTQLQRLAVWVFIGLIALGVIIVFAGFWINFNIITPNLPIANVNGQNIPQSEYHKLVAVKGQLEANKVKGKNGLRTQVDNAQQAVNDAQKTVNTAQNKVNDLNKQIKALPANSSQRPDLETQLSTVQAQLSTAQTQLKQDQTAYNTVNQQDQLEETLDTQQQMETESVQWLQEDLVISNWLNTQSSGIQNKINPTSSQVAKAINDLKANLPKDTSYQQFLSSSNISDSDVQWAMGLIQRRNNMQNYLADQITSPTRQVLVRGITLSTQKDAESVLKQLQGGADFATLAKQKSLDSNTKSKGGELGWLAPGQYMLNDASNLSANVDKWISDPSRTVNQLSPVIPDNGTYHILQIEQIDPSHAISSTDLTALQNNALKYWIEIKKSNGTKFGNPDSTKMADPSNVPSWIPASGPAATPPATS